jgi:enoyl-CoA hydratase/carnithine racemase
MTMLLHFDYVVAATNARFSAPFAKLGVVPEAGSSLLAPRLMGTRRAFALLVMGRPMDAEEAKAVGLVNIVVPPDQVEDEVMKAAREIAALPAEAVAVSRRLIHGSPAEIMKRTIEEAEIFRARLRSPEARAAFEQFLSRKR